MAESSPEKVSKTKVVAKRAPATHPTFLEMSLEAVRATTDHKGASVPAIRNYITETYKTVDPSAVKFRLKQALTRALEREMLVKAKNSEDRPLMSSRFRINKAKAATTSKKKEVKKTVKKSPKKAAVQKAAKNPEGKAIKEKAPKVSKPKEKKVPSKKVTTNREKATKTAKPKKTTTKAEKAKAPKPKVPKTPKTPKSAKKTKKVK